MDDNGFFIGFGIGVLGMAVITVCAMSIYEPWLVSQQEAENRILAQCADNGKATVVGSLRAYTFTCSKPDDRPIEPWEK